MKIDRLIGILFTLLQKEQVTAPYLAEKFEVSRRTINRDIEEICRAGIPVVTIQGKHGGISIMDGFRVDHTLLTSADMQAILAGIRSLDSVSGTNRYQHLMDKLSVGNDHILSSNRHILIDLSSWYKTTLAPKIELIQKAIEQSKLIRFDYYAPAGGSSRQIEPYTLVFQWSSWYVWGYCMSREDYRMFKLNRMDRLCETTKVFTARENSEYRIEKDMLYWNKVQVTALFHPSEKWRLIEDYGMDSFQEQQDGRLLFRFGFVDETSLLNWLLTFRNHVEIVEPGELKQKIKNILRDTLNVYEKQTKRKDY